MTPVIFLNRQVSRTRNTIFQLMLTITSHFFKDRQKKNSSSFVNTKIKHFVRKSFNIPIDNNQ